jgi:hypothetical protein
MLQILSVALLSGLRSVPIAIATSTTVYDNLKNTAYIGNILQGVESFINNPTPAM